MIEIDGNYGEGGGQILRTALGLSCLHQTPFRIFNIRKGRKKPGLMPQHLIAIKAAQLVSAAEVVGDCAGSTELCFYPHGVREGDVTYDIGTAGSTSLVLQTLIPALAFGKKKSKVTLKGGTHVPFSPSFDYLHEVFVPFLLMIGIRVELSLVFYGFYPSGGGKVIAEIHPINRVNPLRLLKRGRIKEVTGFSAVGNLPLSIAERQRDTALARIADCPELLHRPVRIEILKVPTRGKGTFVFLRMKLEHSVAGFTALGARGKRAEIVGEEAAMELVSFYASGASVDRHLSDQIVLYLSLCDGQSEFIVSKVSQHLLTNLWVIGRFRELCYQVDGEVENMGKVTIN
jgi:RNA 3'-terminal phosphate cyclase (ATP)